MAQAFSPTGGEIIGTLEHMHGVALASDYTRAGDGKISFEYDGGTDVNWDGQETVDRDGNRVFVDESGDEWTEDEIRLEGEAQPPEPRLVELAREEGLDTGAARVVARAQEAEPPPPQITIALFREQSEFVRGLLYDYLKNCEDDTQRGFADAVVDQFEQSEAED